MSIINAGPLALIDDLQAARAESDRLFTLLKPDALYERPIAQRHRVLFYIGHLDGFDSIQLCREGLGLKSPDPELDALFQAGIDPDSSHLPTDTPADWPSIDQIKNYVAQCRGHIDNNLEHADECLIQRALEHRYMHLETLAYMFHNFGYEKKNMRPVMQKEVNGSAKPAVRFCDIPAGEAVLGKRRDEGYGWDNEFEQVMRKVPAFSMQSNKVTNGEYLRFVNDGSAMPHFWVRRDNGIFYRGMFEEIPLPLDWPVYVTLNEAKAYATWVGKDLPTEEQFHRAAYGSANGEAREYPWGSSRPTHEHGNFDFKRWDPEPVTASPEGKSAFGVNQLVGNGWEWTKTVFAPFPGFKPSPTYPGYSANFFDGAHFVMKGGSPRTSARLLRRSFRNWFRADYPYVYGTFRCVQN